MGSDGEAGQARKEQDREQWEHVGRGETDARDGRRAAASRQGRDRGTVKPPTEASRCPPGREGGAGGRAEGNEGARLNGTEPAGGASPAGPGLCRRSVTAARPRSRSRSARGRGGGRAARPLTVSASNAPARAARRPSSRCPRPRGGAGRGRLAARAAGPRPAHWLPSAGLAHWRSAGRLPAPPLLPAHAGDGPHPRPLPGDSIGCPPRLSPANSGHRAGAPRRSRPLISRHARRSRPEPRP